MPAPDVGHCVDIGARRVCYGDGPVVVERTLPSQRVPPDGTWRCGGDPRTCVLVERREFACEDGRCKQAHPRLYDDADWECADVHGLVVCRDRESPSGVVAGPAELGWICGDGPNGARICVDHSPDRPGAGNYECRFDHQPSISRTCRETAEATLGGPCRESCPEGMSCLDGACAPLRVETPNCWTDDDCGEGSRCVLAHCSEQPS